MKKIFLISFVISFALFSTAQIKNDSSKHLLFKGVPIDGPLPEYVNKLKKHGYTHKGTDNGLAILEGEFATYKNCTIGVSASVRKNVVSKIVVFFSGHGKVVLFTVQLQEYTRSTFKKIRRTYKKYGGISIG